MEFNNDDGNGDFFFDNGELSAAASEVESQAQLVEPNVGESGGTKSVTITPETETKSREESYESLGIEKV